MIGFAGARVLKETTRQDLPKGFQTAEFLLERGLVDRIIPRPQMRAGTGEDSRLSRHPAGLLIARRTQRPHQGPSHRTGVVSVCRLTSAPGAVSGKGGRMRPGRTPLFRSPLSSQNLRPSARAPGIKPRRRRKLFLRAGRGSILGFIALVYVGDLFRAGHFRRQRGPLRRRGARNAPARTTGLCP